MFRNWLILCILIIGFSVSGKSQGNASKTISYFKDYIISGNDTIICQIDETTLDDSKIRYILPTDPDKTKSIKTENVSELKCRFIYKNVEVDGKTKFLKVLTEDYIMLYSIEKKGKTKMTDKEPTNINQIEKAPARSTFYIGKNEVVTLLTGTNFKTELKQAFKGDDALIARVDNLQFEDLEFTLLNMVIRYNYRNKLDK